MKTLHLILLFLSVFCFIPVFGQSVKINSKQVTYTRPKPTSDFKKTFTVNYPKILGTSPQLINKIEDSISYKRLLSFNPQNEMGEYQWLEAADFAVGYNKNGILSIYLSLTGTAAHETSIGKNAVIDLKTGKRIAAKDVFTNIDNLTAKIREIQKEVIAESVKEIKSTIDYANEDTDDLFKFAKFDKINLENFSVTEGGIIFSYDYGFPYILRIIEPSGNYSLSWKELKPFVKKNGLFGQFVNKI